MKSSRPTLQILSEPIKRVPSDRSLRIVQLGSEMTLRTSHAEGRRTALLVVLAPVLLEILAFELASCTKVKAFA